MFRSALSRVTPLLRLSPPSLPSLKFNLHTSRIPSHRFSTAVIRLKEVPAVEPLGSPLTKFQSKIAIGFTCKPCGQRTQRLISRSSYTKGVVLIRCAGCKNIHLIADHLGWYKHLTGENKTIEQILAEKGESTESKIAMPKRATMSEEPVWELASDKTFKKRLINRGTGLSCPRDGSVCKIRIQALGETFPETLLSRSINLGNKLKEFQEIVIGENDTELDHMLDKILEHMRLRETSDFRFQINRHERISLAREKEVPEFLTMEIRIELLSFTEVPEVWELNPAQLVDAGQHHKDKGVEWFNSGNYVYALRRFTKAVRCLIVIDKEMLEKLAKENADAAVLFREYCTLLANVYTNIAAVQLKVPNYVSVIDICTKALAYQSNNVKALYRRGVAYARSGQNHLARTDLEDALKLAPHDPVVQNELRLLK
ncbi:putative Peptidyl-prolyl cis-trans isomerase FKBP62 [Hypsibius exemplaris]|uniref:Peptidyl-prolyl cis-trans isomerase FKBP62 n=1 Tax=Hypsibius exemplaris TaxID=2072580 RepID=A0A1W0X6S5_HYPEX|nr:putative Peptidyl-prolyl cis-trans isomerase FKBP62 [Hypsibius exemplaris]